MQSIQHFLATESNQKNNVCVDDDEKKRPVSISFLFGSGAVWATRCVWNSEWKSNGADESLTRIGPFVQLTIVSLQFFFLSVSIDAANKHARGRSLVS